MHWLLQEWSNDAENSALNHRNKLYFIKGAIEWKTVFTLA